MKKQRSNRETKNMVQTALWLPREMHDQLKKKAGERGLGEQAGPEAVAKLQATFPNENPETLGRIFARVALHYYKNQPRWPSYPGREDRSAHNLRITKPFDGTQPSPANEGED